MRSKCSLFGSRSFQKHGSCVCENSGGGSLNQHIWSSGGGWSVSSRGPCAWGGRGPQRDSAGGGGRRGRRAETAGPGGGGSGSAARPPLKGAAGTDVSLNQENNVGAQMGCVTEARPLPPSLCDKVSLSGEQQRVVGGAVAPEGHLGGGEGTQVPPTAVRVPGGGEGICLGGEQAPGPQHLQLCHRAALTQPGALKPPQHRALQASRDPLLPKACRCLGSPRPPEPLSPSLPLAPDLPPSAPQPVSPAGRGHLLKAGPRPRHPHTVGAQWGGGCANTKIKKESKGPQ